MDTVTIYQVVRDAENRVMDVEFHSKRLYFCEEYLCKFDMEKRIKALGHVHRKCTSALKKEP